MATGPDDVRVQGKTGSTLGGHAAPTPLPVSQERGNARFSTNAINLLLRGEA